MRRIHQVALLTTLLLLTSCTEIKISHHQIEAGMKICENQGGLMNLYDPDIQPEQVNCGKRCHKYTGMIIYRIRYECKDGTHGISIFKMPEAQAAS